MIQTLFTALTVLSLQLGELPPFEQVSDGYEPVISSIDGTPGMYSIFVNEDENVLMELGPGFEGQPILIAYTI